MQGGLKPAAVLQFTIYSPARQSEHVSPLHFFACVVFVTKGEKKKYCLRAQAGHPYPLRQSRRAKCGEMLLRHSRQVRGRKHFFTSFPSCKRCDRSIKSANTLELPKNTTSPLPFPPVVPTRLQPVSVWKPLQSAAKPASYFLPTEWSRVSWLCVCLYFETDTCAQTEAESQGLFSCFYQRKECVQSLDTWGWVKQS